MQTIKIDALDNLFFRDGKPFDIGDSVWARGLFPPSPSVLYGVLRSAYIAKRPSILKNISNDDPTAKLKIKKIALIGQKGNEKESLLFPIPKDLITNADKENIDKGSLSYLELVDDKDLPSISSHKSNYILKTDIKGKVADLSGNAFLTQSYLSDYLNRKEIVKCELLSNYSCIEPKVGIGRNKTTNTVEEGQLYRFNFLRSAQLVKPDREKNKVLNRLSLIVQFDDLDLDKSGLLKIGTEGKASGYDSYGYTEISKPTLESKYFKIYLATPAIFDNGWRPSKQFCEDNKVKLLTGAIGKPIYIGGFDIQKGEPKTMYKAVPAGTVYFFEANDIATANDFAQNFHGKSISEDMEYNFSHQGFGIAYIGRV